MTNQPGTAVAEWRQFDTQLTAFLGKADEAKLWGDGGGVESTRVVLEIRRACRQVPALRKCTLESIGRAALDAYTTGLTPDGREGYLIPRWNKHALGKNQGAYEAHFMAAWRGLQSLACEGEGGRPAAFVSVTAQVVRKRDKFDWRGGLDPHIEHVPELNAGGPIVAAYAVGFPSADSPERPIFVVVDRAELNRAKAAGGPVWEHDEASMARKTAIRRLIDKVAHTPTARARLAAAQRAFDRLHEVADSERDSTTGKTPLAQRAEAAKEADAQEDTPEDTPPETPEDSGPVVEGEIVDDDGSEETIEPEPETIEDPPETKDAEPETKSPTVKPSPQDIDEIRRTHGLDDSTGQAGLFQDPGEQS